MMNSDAEVRRLLDVMPASGRMMTKIMGKPEQAEVIRCQPPMPWSQNRPIWINFGLWSQLPKPQRDLLILRTVSWLSTSNWLKPNLYQGLAALGLLGASIELWQGDVVGVGVAGGLTAIAAVQVWRGSQGVQVELEADNTALQVAQRRGYSEVDAARHLLAAFESVAQLEGRTALGFDELIRCQNLRVIAGLSSITTADPRR